MVNVELALEIERTQEKFWKNYAEITAYTSEQNKRNCTNYSWQEYFMNNGRVANYSQFPKITDIMLATYIAKDKSGIFYPSEEEIEEIDVILNKGL